MKKKTQGNLIRRISDFVYGRHPYNTIFSWNYLFTRKNIAWAKKYSEEFKGRIVTDYGCGNLPYYTFFKPYADIYYALDFHCPDTASLEKKISYIALNDDGSIPGTSVHELKKNELVLSFQVCNELENIEFYFSEIDKITDRGSILLITTIFGMTTLGDNDRLRVSPYSLKKKLRKAGFNVLIYEPGGFYFSGITATLNLLLVSKNRYDYDSSDIERSKLKTILLTPLVFILNVLSMFLDFILPLKRSPCQYLIIAEKL
jgi:hypothetical protein